MQPGPQSRRLPAAGPEAAARAARGSPGAPAGTPAMLLARGALDADEAPAPTAASSLATADATAPAPLDAPDPLPVAHPEPPAMPVLDVPFDAPAFPGDALRLVPPPGAQGPDPAEADAVARARRDFAAVVESARARHDDVAAVVRREAAELGRRHESVDAGVDPLLDRSAAALDAHHAAARQRVDATADAGIAAVDAAAARTRRRIHGVARAGRRRIAANAATASEQVTAIVDDLAAAYTGLLERLALDIDLAGLQAMAIVAGFGATAHTTYADGGDPIDDARQEARRRTAPGLAGSTVPMLLRSAAAASAAFRAGIPQVRAQFDQGQLGALLHRREQEILTSGGAAIGRAVRQALGAVESQGAAARQSVDAMRRAAHAQLDAARLAARARMAAEARGLLGVAREETASAWSGLAAVAHDGLPAFAGIARGAADGLRRAAEGGAHPLAAAARAAAVEVPPQLHAVAGAQRGAVGRASSGAATAMAALEQDAHDAVTATWAAAAAALEAAAGESAAVVTRAGEQHAAAFLPLADGVRAAADDWARPVADVFARAIAETRRQQREDWGEGSFNRWAVSTRLEQWRVLAGTLLPYFTPAQRFAPVLDDAAGQVLADVDGRIGRLERALNAGIIDRVDEAGVTGALRGLTANQGRALRAKFEAVHRRVALPFEAPELRDYERRHGVLALTLRLALDGDDLAAARHYLAGETAAGAAAELRASQHWYNDEESRIEAVMRDLTPEELGELRRSRDGTEALASVRAALDGSDLNVFVALEQGNHARADAFRMRDRIEEARRRGNADALHAVLVEYGEASQTRGWTTASAEERRVAVQRELAHVLAGGRAADAPSEIAASAAADAVERHALRPVTVVQPTGRGGELRTVELTVTGANADLARELVRHGEGSVDARAARLGVEMQRPGGPRVLNLDTALVDPRLHPESGVSDEERARAVADRERALQRFAERYGGQRPGIAAVAAREYTERRVRAAFGTDRLGADVAARLVTEPHPTPRTAAMAVLLASRGRGTNEALMFRFVERMNRDEVAQMRAHYAFLGAARLYPGAGGTGNLDRDLGTFRHARGWNLSELSGDERLRMERALLGRPRTDVERAEVAAFAAQQQRRETGALGRFLTGGSMADESLRHHADELARLSGARVTVDDDGRPVWTNAAGDEVSPVQTGMFDESGRFCGRDAEAFRSSVRMTEIAAQNYAAQVDAWANFAATGIAILGTIAAAAVSAATGGLAAPLLMAAITATSGLAAMGVRRAIGGGRYGWEQAAADLGVVAVQAITAGLAQKLSLAARGISAAARPAMLQAFTGGRLAASQLPSMGRLTGSAFGDLLLIGGATGALGTAGQAAFSEQLWERGLAAGLELLLETALRGMLTGVTTAAVGSAFEAVPLGRVVPGVGRRTIGSVMSGTTSPVTRAALRGTGSALGGFAGSQVELSVERAAGRYRGDAGDMLVSGIASAAQSAVQDAAGGAVEARAQARGAARAGADDATPARPATAAPDAGPDAPPRPRRDGEEERDPVIPLLRGAESSAQAAPPTPPREPRPLREAAAAAVPDSDFTGTGAAAGTREAARTGTVRGALRRLLAVAGVEGLQIPDHADPSRLRLATRTGEVVDVRVRVARRPLPPIDGLVPVARIRRDPRTGGYEVQVSPGAPARHVERALAHELAEIRAAHGRADVDDVLVADRDPGASAAERPLSPHDEGRLAELGVIARQLRTARTREERAALAADADALVQHLGLAGVTPAADRRRAIAAAALGEGDALDLLVDVVARHSPAAAMVATIGERRRMAARSGVVDEDVLDLPGAPAMRARRGDPAVDRGWVAPTRADRQRVEAWLRSLSRDAFTRDLRAALLDPSLHTPLTLKTLEYLTPREVERVVRRWRLPDDFEFHHLLAVAAFPELAHRGDVGLALPHAVHVGAGHGDATSRPVEAGTFVDPDAESRPPFHVDPEFDVGHRAAPRDVAEGTRSTGDVDRDLAIELAAGLRRAAADAERLERFAVQDADRLADAQAGGARPGEVARLQRRADAARARADAARAEAGRLAAAMAVMAGRAVAEQRLGFPPDTEVPLGRGSREPALLYEQPRGRFVLVGCELAGAPATVAGAEPGTRAFAERLAARMQASREPAVRDAGERLAAALARTPPAVEHVVVRQSFSRGGNPAPPEITRVDHGPYGQEPR